MALNQTPNVVVLVGGVGGAKLAHGLAQILPPDKLTVIVNTGDDLWYYGLRVCPDLDTVMYTLAGVVDKAKGWGLSGDTTHMLDGLRRYGEEAWFGLGDQDIATHLLRTQALRAGESLTQVTARLNRALGVRARVLPMTDSPVATLVDTAEHGEIEFQEYFVRYRWQPTVRAIRFAGIETAAISESVREAVAEADVILFGPSNPWLSILPILSVPGMRDLLMSRAVSRVALSPIVEGRAIKGPAAKIMAELGYTVSPRTVVEFYGDLLTGFIYDERDADLEIDELPNAMFDTVMRVEADRAVLAREILDWTLGKTT